MQSIGRSSVAFRRRGLRRGGFTLIELLIGMVLTSLVLGAMIMALTRQQRFYRGAAAIVETRSQIRQAGAMVSADLRGISTEGDDIISMSDSMLVFRATIGSSVICGLPQANGTMTIPPLALASGNVLTSWMIMPAAGDTILVYDDAGTTIAADDSWRAYAIDSVAAVQGGCGVGSGLTTSSDASSDSYTIQVTATPSATITPSAPVRFVRTMRYKLFQAADDRWYLGFCSPDCGDAGWQAVAGPFLAYSGGGSGVTFTHLDEGGDSTAVPTDVARVGIAVRGRSAPINIPGIGNSYVRDSVKLVVGIRNRRR